MVINRLTYLINSNKVKGNRMGYCPLFILMTVIMVVIMVVVVSLPIFNGARTD